MRPSPALQHTDERELDRLVDIKKRLLDSFSLSEDVQIQDDSPDDSLTAVWGGRSIGEWRNGDTADASADSIAILGAALSGVGDDIYEEPVLGGEFDDGIENYTYDGTTTADGTTMADGTIIQDAEDTAAILYTEEAVSISDTEKSNRSYSTSSSGGGSGSSSTSSSSDSISGSNSDTSTSSYASSASSDSEKNSGRSRDKNISDSSKSLDSNLPEQFKLYSADNKVNSTDFSDQDGYNVGYAADRTAEYSNEYSDSNTGITVGFTNGYLDGYIDAYPAIWAMGFTSRTIDEFNTEDTDGYTAGYEFNTEYTDGYTAGYTIGFSAGYTDFTEATHPGGFTNGFTDDYNYDYTESPIVHYMTR